MKKIIVIISSIAIFVTVVLVLLQAEEQITPIDSTKCPHRALLVMDLQKDFIGEDAKYPVEKSQVEPMLKAINNIIKRAGELDLEVIYIDTKFSKEQWLTNWFRNYAAIEGSEGVSLDERLSVTSKRIFTKNKQSAFTNKEFGQYLKERAIGKIIVAGVLCRQMHLFYCQICQIERL